MPYVDGDLVLRKARQEWRGAAIAVAGLVLTLVLIRSRDSRAHIQLGAEERAAA
jgi:hypothetical protein